LKKRGKRKAFGSPGNSFPTIEGQGNQGEKRKRKGQLVSWKVVFGMAKDWEGEPKKIRYSEQTKEEREALRGGGTRSCVKRRLGGSAGRVHREDRGARSCVGLFMTAKKASKRSLRTEKKEKKGSADKKKQNP